ncbi:MAG: hypothetical protein Q7S33_04030 [Nanoarchaeota archaeon]|nr:hypothetical protein [Nanoarchaeota archaeon]
MALNDLEKLSILNAYEPSDRIPGKAVKLLEQENFFTTEGTIKKYWESCGLDYVKYAHGGSRDHSNQRKAREKKRKEPTSKYQAGIYSAHYLPSFRRTKE